MDHRFDTAIIKSIGFKIIRSNFDINFFRLVQIVKGLSFVFVV